MTPASAFARLAGVVYHADDYSEVYRAVCTAAPRLVGGCDHASLMLVRDGGFTTAAANDEIARHIDELEREVGAGPCVDAIEDETGYVDADLTEGSPWPALRERVLAETPVRGMAGFRLVVDERKAGALNLFADTPGRLDTRSVNEAVLLASFVSVAMVAAHRREDATNLRAGLESNREIGKAVGLLMAFHKVSADDAFEKLKQASQVLNVKLVEVARQFVEHQENREA